VIVLGFEGVASCARIAGTVAEEAFGRPIRRS
jgi:hypothetical protein